MPTIVPFSRNFIFLSAANIINDFYYSSIIFVTTKQATEPAKYNCTQQNTKNSNFPLKFKRQSFSELFLPIYTSMTSNGMIRIFSYNNFWLLSDENTHVKKNSNELTSIRIELFGPISRILVYGQITPLSKKKKKRGFTSPHIQEKFM